MGPVVYMASTKLLVGLLGIGLTFAPTPLYAYYRHQARSGASAPIDDQPWRARIMALEQSIVMGIALAWLFVRAGRSPRPRSSGPSATRLPDGR